MAWINNEPDGTPFAPATDSFENAYNVQLAMHGADGLPANLSPTNGFPFSTRNFQAVAGGAKTLRPTMNYYFDPGVQRDALASGNTPDELDMLAKRLLAHAVMCDCPVTDRERAMAERLGVNVLALPREIETPAGTVY